MPISEFIKLKRVRLSFPRLFKARSFRPGQDPRYESTFLLDPSDKAHKKIIDEIESVADEIIADQWPKKMPKKLIRCFGMADEEGQDYDGYEGMFFIRTAAQEKDPPGIYDAARNELVIDPKTGAEPRIPYAGCIVDASISLWTMDNEFGQRVNANLRLVKFVKDGEAFGVAPANPEEELDFDDEDEGEDGFLDD